MTVLFLAHILGIVTGSICDFGVFFVMISHHSSAGGVISSWCCVRLPSWAESSFEISFSKIFSCAFLMQSFLMSNNVSVCVC